MPKFIYTAKTDPRKTLRGEVEAESEQEAANKILQMGQFPLTLTPALERTQQKDFWGSKKVAKKELLLFTHQLSRLLESGVTILKSLAIVSHQTQNKYFKTVIEDVSRAIKDGKPLSHSLAEYPHIFSPLYSSTILAGEASGTIEKSLKHLAEFFEKEESFNNSVRQGLMYPAFVALVGAASIIVLLTFAIPRLVSMFEDMGQALPLPTVILINVSGFLSNFWWLLILGLVVVVVSFRRFYRTHYGKSLIDAFKLAVPVAGEITLKTEIGRLMRTLALLAGSGIPIVSSLETATAIVDNEVVKAELKKFKEQITTGVSLSKAMQDSKLFPSFTTNIIAVGEESGNLEASLASIADEYQSDVDRALKAFTSLLEPVVILIMGLIVGFIVTAMLLPIFQINLIAK